MSSLVYEVPLQSGTPQTLSISLAGVTYNLTLTFNTVAQSWTLDIDDSSGNPLVHGIPLVTGADLLAQYGYLNFGGQLFATTDFDPTAPPTFNNLGQTGHLYFVTA
jgi:hypothetical protein